MSSPDGLKETPSQHASEKLDVGEDEFIDLRDIIRRLGCGLGQTLGLALLGLVIAALSDFAVTRFQAISTSARVVFSFSGFGRGQYPDGSNFTASDLIAPDVIATALKREGFETSSDFQAEIVAGLDVEGVIPADVARARDHARSLGQNPPTYTPDEYAITLTLKRGFPLSRQQRDHLLNAIINCYREKFERTYVDVPLAFGNAFETLRDADYFEYEMILNQELDNVTAFLLQRVEVAKSFR